MKQRLQHLRAALGVNQSQFADAIGVKRSTVSNWETGYPVPDIAVNLICHTYRVRREWLTKGDGEIFEPKPIELVSDEELIVEAAHRIFRTLTTAQQDAFRKFCREIADGELEGKTTRILNSFGNFSGTFNQNN